jgi:Protein of unknown function (DUF2855)
MTVQNTDFIVNRTDLRDCRFVTNTLEPGAGEVLLGIERFAFTANNITYAVAGDSMAYWQFFPAAEGWGRVPVWGFAVVLQSNCPDIAVGERVYGYLPMSTHLVVRPDRITDSGFVDAVAHRAQRAAVYNQYQRVSHDPAYSSAHDAAQMLLRPLFMTSFILDDMLADNDFFGARAVILSSASSKTALGLAYLLKQNRAVRVEVVGLTSDANRQFVANLGYYDRVVTYAALAELDATTPVVFVDVAGNGDVLRAVHAHFNERLRHSCIVGATHWEQALGSVPNLPGPRPTMFFAPAHIQKRNKDWGRGGVETRFAAAWNTFVPAAMGWLKVVDGRGQVEVERVYRELLAGKTAPDVGYLLTLNR